MSKASLLPSMRMEPPSAKRPRRKALVLDSDDENDDFVVSPKSKAPAAARTSVVVCPTRPVPRRTAASVVRKPRPAVVNASLTSYPLSLCSQGAARRHSSNSLQHPAERGLCC